MALQAVEGLGEQTALKAGVDGLDAQLGIEQLAVTLEEDVAHRGVLGVAQPGYSYSNLASKAQHVGERLAGGPRTPPAGR